MILLHLDVFFIFHSLGFIGVIHRVLFRKTFVAAVIALLIRFNE